MLLTPPSWRGGRVPCTADLTVSNLVLVDSGAVEPLSAGLTFKVDIANQRRGPV